MAAKCRERRINPSRWSGEEIKVFCFFSSEKKILPYSP
jgi:hypothetical protein